MSSAFQVFSVVMRGILKNGTVLGTPGKGSKLRFAPPCLVPAAAVGLSILCAEPALYIAAKAFLAEVGAVSGVPHRVIIVGRSGIPHGLFLGTIDANVDFSAKLSCRAGDRYLLSAVQNPFSLVIVQTVQGFLVHKPDLTNDLSVPGPNAGIAAQMIQFISFQHEASRVSARSH